MGEYIVEVIIVSGRDDAMHMAPFGIRHDDNRVVISPYRPSRTLNNLLAHKQASVNMTDDPLVFAGCLTKRHKPSLKAARSIDSMVLSQAAFHQEIKVQSVVDDPQRPRFYCAIEDSYPGVLWSGFNRARAAIIEACVVVSRLGILPRPEIDRQMRVLAVVIDKTAGDRERQAWQWLEDFISDYDQAKAVL